MCKNIKFSETQPTLAMLVKNEWPKGQTTEDALQSKIQILE